MTEKEPAAVIEKADETECMSTETAPVEEVTTAPEETKASAVETEPPALETKAKPVETKPLEVTKAPAPETTQAPKKQEPKPKTETKPKAVETKPKETEAKPKETTPAPKEETHTKTIAEEQAERGIYARLYIYSLGVDVALFYPSDLNKLQYYVDQKDSAALFDWSNNNVVIADHNYQGFDKIKKAVPGKTVAYIAKPYETVKLKCVAKIPEAFKTGTGLVCRDGTSILDSYSGKYVMYTCNSSSANSTVTVTIWSVC